MRRLPLNLLCSLLAPFLACHPAGRVPVVPDEIQVPRPAGCIDLRPSADRVLQAEIEATAPGARLCLAPGQYRGPIELRAGRVLWGPRGAVLQSSGRGTTARIHDGSRLLGLSVDGSGGRFDVLDAAVHLEGKGGRVEGVEIRHALFGILAEKASGVQIRGNHVIGSGTPAIGLRGDAIRLWETYDSTVEENRVEGARDVVVWYSSRNLLRKNTVIHGRYGTHFMYSHGNTVEDSRYLFNEVGIFAMYSRDLTVQRNLLAGAGGAAGIGLGVKESGNLTVRDNQLVQDTVGVYLDTSPLQEGEANLFERNLFQLSEVGILFHSSEHQNTFRANRLKDNAVQVQVDGGGDALEVSWDGNQYDDYQGYDLNGDGVGDLPYQLSDLSDELVSRYPDLAFFRGSAALELVSLAGKVLPLFAPKPVLIDLHPRLDLSLGESHAG